MAEAKKTHLSVQKNDTATLESIVFSWWASLEHDRGARAELRRATSPAAVIFAPAYHALLRRIREENLSIDREYLAVIAAVVSQVKRHSLVSLPRQLAASAPGGSRARFSGLRFRRLLAIDDLVELQVALIRVVRHLDGAVNIGDVTRAIRFWNDKTKKDWAFAYYEAAPKED